MQIGVVGAGSFGTALAKMLAQSGHSVRLWARSDEQAALLNEERENKRYLPGFPLPPELECTPQIDRVLAGAKLVLAVVPSHGMREVMSRAAAHLERDAVVVSASKGIENDSLRTMSEILSEVLPKSIATAFLSGPSFAREVAEGLPTAVSVASTDIAVAEGVQEALATDRFRVYTTTDVVGVELGGALKNVIAIAAGTADGLGLGHNARAAILTRGLAEVSRLAVRRGASPLTFAGLSGIGDLVLTCTGELSRNRRVGMELGRGKTLQEVLSSMRMVAEGVRTTRSAHDLARQLDVEMPITEQVHALLFEGRPAIEAVGALMRRAQRAEAE